MKLNWMRRLTLVIMWFLYFQSMKPDISRWIPTLLLPTTLSSGFFILRVVVLYQRLQVVVSKQSSSAFLESHGWLDWNHTIALPYDGISSVHLFLYACDTCCQGCARMMSKIGGIVGGGGWKYAHGTAHYGRNFRLKWLKVSFTSSLISLEQFCLPLCAFSPKNKTAIDCCNDCLSCDLHTSERKYLSLLELFIAQKSKLTWKWLFGCMVFEKECW